MTEDWQERTELLLGEKKLRKISNSRILVVGLGGVGAYAAEMLCRAGVGHLHIIDADIIHASNRNRQLLALKSTEGESKAELMKQRLLDINPNLKITAERQFITGEISKELLSHKFDYIVDAIDSISPKIFLIANALKENIPIISSMGSGGKTNPTKIHIADFKETYNDKLARMLRKRMHKMGIYGGFKVVFSSEQTDPNAVKFIDNERNKKTTVGTLSYMPAMFGSFMAAEIIRELAEIQDFSLADNNR